MVVWEFRPVIPGKTQRGDIPKNVLSDIVWAALEITEKAPFTAFSSRFALPKWSRSPLFDTQTSS